MICMTARIDAAGAATRSRYAGGNCLIGSEIIAPRGRVARPSVLVGLGLGDAAGRAGGGAGRGHTKRQPGQPSRYNIAHVRTPLRTPPPALRIFCRRWHRPPRDAVKNRRGRRHGALALTDLANAFGLIRFYKEARGGGVKPLVGADVWLTNADDRDKAPRLQLLVQDRRGYLNLCTLLSRARLVNQYRGRAEIDPAGSKSRAKAVSRWPPA